MDTMSSILATIMRDGFSSPNRRAAAVAGDGLAFSFPARRQRRHTSLCTLPNNGIGLFLLLARLPGSELRLLDSMMLPGRFADQGNMALSKLHPSRLRPSFW
jgi:hypothetical protein